MVTLNDTPAGNSAAVPTYETRTLYQVPIDLIRENPDQPRKCFDAQGLEEMVASVAKHGIIQPVLFRRGPDGTAIIVAGERRVAAARQVGLTEIPGIFVEGNAAEIALIENLQRQDLTWVEEAEALQRLMTEQQYTQEQLGGGYTPQVTGQDGTKSAPSRNHEPMQGREANQRSDGNSKTYRPHQVSAPSLEPASQCRIAGNDHSR